jgi:hypothetical protein
MEQDEWMEAILTVTGGTDWDVVKKWLATEIYTKQAESLEAENWDVLCENRGFAQGLAYIMNIRETVIAIKAQEVANANL